MIPSLEVAGLFVVIAAILHFSTWAEAWLAPKAAPIIERRPDDVPSVAGTTYQLEPGTIRAA